MKQYLVLDMGGTFVKYALMKENNEIIDQGKIPSATTSVEDLLDSISEAAEKYKGQYEGVAASMPGRIDSEKGIAHTGGTFLFFQNTPFGSMLEERLEKPVTLANDGKCAAMAEARYGALKDYDNGAVFVIGTGIGGGVILNKKVWMGTSGSAGEFSWLISDYQSFAKRPLNLENAFDMIWAGETSAPGLAKRYAAKKNETPAKHSGITFFEAYDKGDPDAIAALDEFGRIAAAGLMTIQATLDLQCYAIGGGISARREVTDVIRKSLYNKYEECSFIPFSRPEIVTCHYGNDANLIGALSFHLERRNQ